MKSNYKRIGDYIQLVDVRNTGLKVKNLLGLSISKQFIPSVANIIGTDMENYKIIRKKQFACSTMQVRRDKKMPVALLREVSEAIISQAYPVFEVIDEKELFPEYLMMWFSRSEFDREACFHAVGGVRGSLEWEDFCNMQFPVPPITKQKEIAKEYNAIQNHIIVNQQLIQKLEETIQAIYKHWFVDFEFPGKNGKPYKSNGGEMVFNAELETEIPVDWTVEPLKSICSKIGSGSTPKGGKESYHATGTSLVRSLNVHDFRFSYDDLAFINEQQAKALEGVSLSQQDILLNITGVSVARCCIIPDFALPARVNQHVMIIRPKPESYLANYLLCLLCSTDSKAKLLGISQAGSTREAITKEEVDRFHVVVPEKLIAKSFDDRLNKLRRIIEFKTLYSNRLKNLKDLLLSKLATIEN